MKILVLNCGSSSIKYKLFDMDAENVLAQGGIEKIGLEDSFLKLTLPNGEKVILEKVIAEHTAGIEFILETLTSQSYGCISSLSEVDAVGHRVVHGGEKFSQSVLITPEIIEQVNACSELAPLHNPANLKGIDAIAKILPNVPQIAVFDTSFHQTMPDYAYLYAVPYEYYEKYGVRRYGFHGTSHRYVSKCACDFLGLNYSSTKIISAHIGNGGSITAVYNGKSVDTSMGLTPLEGLMMGTRAGNIDTGAVLYIANKENLSTIEISDMLNKKSGLLGISGVSSDMRDIDNAVSTGNRRADLALKMYEYNILKYIGAYAAVMNGVDVLVFTGGVGENQTLLRERLCRSLSYMGVDCDVEVNSKSRGVTMEISTNKSKVRVVVIPTDEELMIALDAKNLIS